MKSIFLLVSLLAISSNSLASEAPLNSVEPTANHGMAPQALTDFSWGGGAKLNGSKLNGLTLNGFRINGFRMNGFRMNGLTFNGMLLNGFRLNGIAQSPLKFDSALGHDFTFVSPPLKTRATTNAPQLELRGSRLVLVSQ